MAEAMTPSSVADDRLRFSGKPSDLADALRPMANKKAFIEYEECEVVSKAKTLPDSIAKAHDVLSALKALQPNLAFRKSDVVAALDLLVTEFNGKWQLNAESRADYAKIMDLRIRNLCYVTNCGERKTPPPKWVSQLPWLVGDTGAESATPAAATTAPEAAATPAAATTTPAATTAVDLQLDKWSYNYDKNLKVAFRCQHGKKHREISGPPFFAEDAGDTDPMLARFKNGAVWPIDSVTVGAWKFQSAHRGGTTVTQPALWSGERASNHNKVTVVQRADRELLLAVFEQCKPVRWMRVDVS